MRVGKITALILLSLVLGGCQKEAVKEIENLKGSRKWVFKSIDLPQNLSSEDPSLQSEAEFLALKFILPRSAEEYENNPSLPRKIDIFEIPFKKDQPVNLVDMGIYLNEGDIFSFMCSSSLEGVSLFLFEIDGEGTIQQIFGNELGGLYRSPVNKKVLVGCVRLDENLNFKGPADKKKQENIKVKLLIQRSEKKLDVETWNKIDKKDKEILGKKPTMSFIYPKKMENSNLVAFPLFTGIIFTGYLWWQKKHNEKVIGLLPKPKTSMKELYEEDKKTKFFCVHCGNPLKITGKFICRAGHVPKRDRVVFKNCPVCDDIHNKIRCEQCGGEIELYEKNYCEEEILNRGKKYISRPVFEKEDKGKIIIGGVLLVTFNIFLIGGGSYLFDLFHGGFFKIGEVVIFEFFADNYYRLYSVSKLNPFMISTITPLIDILVIIACYLIFPKKERVMENPYEAQVL